MNPLDRQDRDAHSALSHRALPALLSKSRYRRGEGSHSHWTLTLREDVVSADKSKPKIFIGGCQRRIETPIRQQCRGVEFHQRVPRFVGSISIPGLRAGQRPTGADFL